MSEFEEQKKKRQAFIKIAKKNKRKFDKHLTLKKSVFGNIDPKHLETIIKNGATDDLFSLLLLEYGEAFHEWKLEQLDLPIVSKSLKVDIQHFDLTDCPHQINTFLEKHKINNNDIISIARNDKYLTMVYQAF
tara:strand:+ start:859 stop:1257 length:399 start_codon:yes stop_codon:yes gene_type:complete